MISTLQDKRHKMVVFVSDDIQVRDKKKITKKSFPVAEKTTPSVQKSQLPDKIFIY
jgi:hypothetical protein